MEYKRIGFPRNGRIFLRGIRLLAQTANDYASTDDVIREVLECYRAAGREFDTFCCIYPTAPFITPKKLYTAMGLLKDAESVTRKKASVRQA